MKISNKALLWLLCALAVAAGTAVTTNYAALAVALCGVAAIVVLSTVLLVQGGQVPPRVPWAA